MTLKHSVEGLVQGRIGAQSHWGERERERERANMHELITRVLCGGIIDSSVAASLIHHHRESLLLHQDADYHQTSQ